MSDESISEPAKHDADQPTAPDGTSLRVVIVVPTYNEAETLPLLVEKVIAQKISGLGFIVVDDGSPDGTGDVADRLADEFPGVFLVLPREGQQGLGTAYMAGFHMALGAGAARLGVREAHRPPPRHAATHGGGGASGTSP